MDRNICFIIYVIFVMYTARDFIYKWTDSTGGGEKTSATHSGHHHHSSHHHNYDHQSDYDNERTIGDVKKEIPTMSFHNAANQRPTIKFFYCYSCGYQRAFDEYRKMITDRFPDLNILGENYNPSFFKSKLAQFFSVAKMVVIALLMANINPFNYFGLAIPNYWIWMQEHKLYACLMTFFLSNTLESQLMSSGAFEIFYNDVPIWSKLASGRVPSPNELFDMIDSQHKFYQTDMFSSGRTL